MKQVKLALNNFQMTKQVDSKLFNVCIENRVCGAAMQQRGKVGRQAGRQPIEQRMDQLH